MSDGVFTPSGTFIPLTTLAIEPFLKLWEHKVFKLLLDEGLITHETVEQMRSWQHSGFSAEIKRLDFFHLSVRIEMGKRCLLS